MWDDEFDEFWFEGRRKKQSNKFLTYEEGNVTLERSGEFHEYLCKQKMSDSAIRTYPADVADFHGWVQNHYQQGLPRRLYREHVIAYRDALKQQRVNPQTINHKLSALRKYNEYMIARKYQRGEVFKRGDFLKIRPKKPKALGIADAQISKFLAKVRKAGNPRDIAIATLLAYTGIRLQEVLNLGDRDVDWNEAQVTVIDEGKKHTRIIPLHKDALKALKDYDEVRSDLTPKAILRGYFFPGQSGSKLNHSTVNRLFKKHSKTITPKTLRQCFQVDQLNQGATVAEVVELTGADAQTISGLIKLQAETTRKRIHARQL